MRLGRQSEEEVPGRGVASRCRFWCISLHRRSACPSSSVTVEGVGFSVLSLTLMLARPVLDIVPLFHFLIPPEINLPRRPKTDFPTASAFDYIEKQHT